MQYIPKSPDEPPDWARFFTKANGQRSYDYKSDAGELPELREARAMLLAEQHGLCAYCQKTLSPHSAAIEHVLPKSQNPENSTLYHNLVAVCARPEKDAHTGLRHCDKARGHAPITPFIFYRDAQVRPMRNHAFFSAGSDGRIGPKKDLPAPLRAQVEAFIALLNLNHSGLVARRKAVLDALLSIFAGLPQASRKAFFQNQFDAHLRNPGTPYRQFLLIFLAHRLGIN